MSISAPLIAAAVVGASAPLAGVFVVSRRQAFLADALSHVSLVGIAVATLLNAAPLPITLAVVIAMSLLLEELSLRRANLAQEALLAMALSGALALANVLLSARGGDPEELETLLFGNIEGVTSGQLPYLIGLCVVIAGALLWFRKSLFLLSLDKDIANASGLNVGLYSRILSVLVACMVVLMASTIGVLLCGSLLVIPALIARLLARHFHQALWIAVLAGELSVIVGYIVGTMFALPIESTMVLTAILLFMSSALLSRRQ